MDYMHCLLFAFMHLLQCVKGEHAYVTVDPSLQGQGQCNLPSTVKFSLETGSDILTLNLVRNDHVHPNVPSYIIKMGEDEEYRFILEEPAETKSLAAYQDPEYEAAIFVKCYLHPQTGAQLEMEGSLFVQSLKYRIVPSKAPVSFYRRLFHSGEEKLYHMVRAKEAVPFDLGIGVDEHEEIMANSLKDIVLPSDDHARVKRAVPGPVQDINIDVLLLLEYSIIQEWNALEGAEKGKEKAKEYFALLLNAVNLRYQNIRHDEYKFNIRLIGYYISEDSSSSPWSENNTYVNNTDGIKRTHATDVLADLKEWVNTTRGNTGKLMPHDHIMLFTSYDLVGTDNGFRFNYTTGYAYVEAMCYTDGRSISVVEDHGGFQSVGTAAHEIGHSLGAKHDGEDNICSKMDRYVMAPASSNEREDNKYNPWFFSNCSVEYFISFINKSFIDPERRKCLSESITPQNIPSITGLMPGQLYDPDEQCRHQYGNESYLCRGVEFDVGKILCRAMFCSEPGTRICLSLSAARGTSCGNKKWCINGECQYSVDAPENNDKCPFGDQPTFMIGENPKTCNVLSERRSECYRPVWSTTCCSTCQRLCNGHNGCTCGDRQFGCVKASCRQYNDSVRSDCCDTCKDYVPDNTTSSDTTPSDTRSSAITPSDTTPTTPTSTVTYPSTCTDVIKFEGVTCAEYVQDRGRHACYNTHVNRSCCEACSVKINTTFEKCPWGDHSPASCYPLKGFKPGSVCPEGIVSEKCCETCGKLNKQLVLPATVNRNSTSEAVSVFASVLSFASVGVISYCVYYISDY